MIKKTKIFTLLIIVLLLAGCSNSNENKNKISNTEKNDDNSVLHCTRKAEANNATTSLKYSIYYKGEYVTKTVSVEKITSDDNNVLNQYKEAYEKVFATYKNLDYYDNKIERINNNVISTTVIDYEKVDTKKILEIEGEEGNIFESDGKVKKEKLLAMYKKYGATCE